MGSATITGYLRCDEQKDCFIYEYMDVGVEYTKEYTMHIIYTLQCVTLFRIINIIPYYTARYTTLHT